MDMDMETVLDEIEVRILGCLIEKEMTTPEYYPLTLNALTNACNQKSNRSPVVSYEEPKVTRGIDSLRQRGMAMRIQREGSRVPKYEHFLKEKFKLTPGELAALCELMLRGPQTVGEIRSRAERMYPFKGLEEVEEILQTLGERNPPLVAKLPRQPGRKEHRYTHLFSGEPEIHEEESAVFAEPSNSASSVEWERIAALEEEVATLRSELNALKEAFAGFRSQFE